MRVRLIATIRAMSTRRVFAVTAAAVTAVLLSLAQWAVAAPRLLGQPEAPPPLNELGAPKPWTYWMARALLLAAAGALFGTVVLYVVKARSFRPNQRRGGAK